MTCKGVSRGLCGVAYNTSRKKKRDRRFQEDFYYDRYDDFEGCGETADCFCKNRYE